MDIEMVLNNLQIKITFDIYHNAHSNGLLIKITFDIYHQPTFKWLTNSRCLTRNRE